MTYGKCFPKKKMFVSQRFGAGFTFIETVIAIAVFALALGAVSGFLLLGYRTQGFAFEQSQAVGEARKGVDQMVKELREATTGEDGSYLLEVAGDYEIVFYADLDKDNETERIQYLVNPAGGVSGSDTQFCTSFAKGGSCSILFSGFLQGSLESATVQVSVEGDLNAGNETVDVSGDGLGLGTLCSGGACGQCVGSYQAPTSFDVTAQASNGTLEVIADSSNAVDPVCDWQEPDHSLKAQVRLDWQEQATQQSTAVFQKTVTDPVGWPPTYTGTSQNSVISENVRNEARGEPLFVYYDKDNNVLADPALRLSETTRVHVKLIINVNPLRAPEDFGVETDVQLRNRRPNL